MDKDKVPDRSEIDDNEILREAIADAIELGNKKVDINKSSLEKIIPGEGLIERERRAFLKMASMFVSGMGLVGVGVVTSIPSTLISTSLLRKIDSFWENNNITLDSNFLDYISKFRGTPEFSIDNAREHIGVSINKSEENIITWIDIITNGGLLSPRDKKLLDEMIKNCVDHKSKLLLCNLLATDYIRSGNSPQARDVLSLLEINKYVSQHGVEMIADLFFSVNYTSLKSENYLVPQKWGFETAFQVAEHAGLDILGLNFKKIKSGIYELDLVSTPNNENLLEYESNFAVSGLYNLFWSLHYMAAYKINKSYIEGRDIINKTLYLLIWFANRNVKYKRAVWNCMFISGLQAHRFGIDDMRDKMFKHMLGINGNIYDLNHMNDRLKNGDVVPYCAALFLVSNNDVCKKIGFTKIPSMETIEKAGKLVKADQIRSSADIFAKLRGENIDQKISIDNNIFWGRGLGVYIEEQTTIRRGLTRKT